MAAVAAQAGGATGEALAQSVAITVNDRTNTVVVAGKEEAVALVEVLRERLDSQVAVGWIEPRILPLKYADARDLAETLRAVLVEGAGTLPESAPLQKQVGRIRMARAAQDGRPAAAIESDVFAPFTQLVIRPELATNALVLVGSTQNLDQTYTVNLSSEALNGMWMLRVNDNAWGNAGMIDYWSITF